MGTKRSTGKMAGTGVASYPASGPTTKTGDRYRKTGGNSDRKVSARRKPDIATKKGKAHMSQGGESTPSDLGRGRTRTNRGKNNLTAGPQGFRG